MPFSNIPVILWGRWGYSTRNPSSEQGILGALSQRAWGAKAEPPRKHIKSQERRFLPQLITPHRRRGTRLRDGGDRDGDSRDSLLRRGFPAKGKKNKRSKFWRSFPRKRNKRRESAGSRPESRYFPYGVEKESFLPLPGTLEDSVRLEWDIQPSVGGPADTRDSTVTSLIKKLVILWENDFSCRGPYQFLNGQTDRCIDLLNRIDIQQPDGIHSDHLERRHAGKTVIGFLQTLWREINCTVVGKKAIETAEKNQENNWTCRKGF